MSLACKLLEVGAIKFGEFTLKSGIISPIYIDLRLTISYPKIIKEITSYFHKKSKGLHYDLLCGVPYTALPFASQLSVEQNVPMIMTRKEKKDYGTKKMVEGVFEPNQKALIIEDIVTSGSSILETVQKLNEVELQVTDALVLIDREQEGDQKLQNENIHLHSIFTLSEILHTLQQEKRIDPLTVQSVMEFIRGTKV